jgi:hypothetical protein
MNADSPQKRRARVRKAQQAFQKRKEAAVQSLEERLNNVQNGLEEFSTAFTNFTTDITARGIAEEHPQILHQIHDLTERLLVLARIASPDAGSDDDDQASASTKHDPAHDTRKQHNQYEPSYNFAAGNPIRKPRRGSLVPL